MNPASPNLVERGIEAAVVVLQAALGAVALQDLALLVVLHARVAAEHALLRPAVGAVPLTLGHLWQGRTEGREEGRDERRKERRKDGKKER